MNGIRAVRKELADAPPEARRDAWIGLGVVTLVIGFAGWDVLRDTGPGETLRWTAAVVGSVGLLLHTVSDVLRRTGRERGGPEGAAPSERFRSPVLRSTYLVLPRWALGGTVLLAAATGLEVVIGFTHPRFWVAAALFGYFAYRSSVTVLASARELYGEASAQRDRAERSRRKASEAHLLALQARMNPHFLFNALNTVAALARTDPPAAERTTEALASVLRQTLRRSEALLGTVQGEVDFVEAYLDVERQRWGDRLDVEWEVDRKALDARLPPMTLQPLVENALVHGIGARLEGGTIRITLRREGGILAVAVADDGPGMGREVRENTGLGNLRERLDTLYGDGASVEVDSSRSGTTVRFRIPAEPPRSLRNTGGDRAANVPCAS